MAIDNPFSRNRSKEQEWRKKYNNDEKEREEKRKKQILGAIPNLLISSEERQLWKNKDSQPTPIPELYENGKINPAYNTSKVQDALAGLGLGASKSTGNPYYDIGASIGGLLGGVANKNIAGKIKYQEDIALINQQNEIRFAQTQASARLEQIANQQEIAQRKLKLQEERQARQLKYQESKQKQSDEKYRRQILQDNIDSAISSGDYEDARPYQQELAILNGYVLDPEDREYGWNLSKPQKIGNFYYQTSKNGTVRQATDENGKPLTSFTPQDWIRMTSQTKNFDPQKAKDSYDKAVVFVEQLQREGKVKFTTPTGKVNNTQKNAYIQKVADDIYEGSLKGEIPSTIVIGNEVYSYSSQTGLTVQQPQQTQENTQQTQQNEYINATEEQKNWASSFTPEQATKELKTVTDRMAELDKVGAKRTEQQNREYSELVGKYNALSWKLGGSQVYDATNAQNNQKRTSTDVRIIDNTDVQDQEEVKQQKPPQEWQGSEVYALQRPIQVKRSDGKSVTLKGGWLKKTSFDEETTKALDAKKTEIFTYEGTTYIKIDGIWYEYKS